MSIDTFRTELAKVLERLWSTQREAIQTAAAMMGESVAGGGLVHLFGSGHSVLPVLDMFPRYGSYPVFRPLMDMRLMWTNVIGSGARRGCCGSNGAKVTEKCSLKTSPSGKTT